MVAPTFEKERLLMLFALLFMLPLQVFAAAPAPSAELTQKCGAVWDDLKPLVLTPVFASLEEQEPAIAKALTAHGLINNEQVVTLIRTGLSKAWWYFRGHKT